MQNGVKLRGFLSWVNKMSDKTSLQFDNKVTLSFILTLALQTACALMWAGAAEARLKVLEQNTDKAVAVSERLARLEEKVDLTRQTLSRIAVSYTHLTLPTILLV